MKDQSPQITALLGRGGFGKSWAECPFYPGVALVEAKAGNKAQAMKTLERAAKLVEAMPKENPAKRHIALTALACVQARLGEFAEARKTLERIQGEPGKTVALATLVRELAHAGRAKEAIDAVKAELERAVRVSQDLLAAGGAAATPRKGPAAGRRGSGGSENMPAAVVRPGEFLTAELARRSSGGAGKGKRRRKYDSGLGFLDEEELDIDA